MKIIFIYRSGVMRGTGRPLPLGRGWSPPSSSCTKHVSRQRLYATNSKVYLLMGRIRLCATKAQENVEKWKALSGK